MNKQLARVSALAWTATAVMAGSIVGLDHLLPVTYVPPSLPDHAGSGVEIAMATAAALVLAPILLLWWPRRSATGTTRPESMHAWFACGASSTWLLLRGQLWVKNHPTVDRARSVEGLLLEMQLLICALGIGLLVGGAVYGLISGFRRSGRATRILAAAAVSICAIALAGSAFLRNRHSPATLALAAYREAASADYNVLLITLDTQRADHIGSYGADVATPHIDALARGGIQFDRAYSTTNVTIPSHATILTSRWMKEHGLESNFCDPLPAANITLAEVLRRAGYRTGAFTSVFILDREYSGLMQGIETSWAPERGSTPSEEAFGRAANWMESLDEQRFFAWVHSYDVHRPYAPLAPYDTLYYSGRSDDPDNLSFMNIPSMHPRPFGVTDIEYYPAMYKGETTYQDAQLGVLFDRMKEMGILDRTLIVLTADHGESLGEHDFYYSHDALYEEDVRVPMILNAPDLVPAGVRCDALVQTIDIVPTVLDLLGLSALATASGKSMLPLIRGAETPIRKRAYFEGQNYRAIGMADSTWSFIHPLKEMVPNHNVELFRIDIDPSQEQNLFYKERAVAEEYLELARTFTGKSIREGRGSKSRVPASLAQQLNALGYVQ